TPEGVALGQINQQARIEVDQSHDRLSCSIAESISATERRAYSGKGWRSSQSRMARALPVPEAAPGVSRAGTSRATGSPRLAMTASSPAWTDLISCDSRFLASKIFTCIPQLPVHTG